MNSNILRYAPVNSESFTPNNSEECYKKVCRRKKYVTDEKQTAAIVKVKEEFRLTSWRFEYEEMRKSGMTVKDWCA